MWHKYPWRVLDEIAVGEKILTVVHFNREISRGAVAEGNLKTVWKCDLRAYSLGLMKDREAGCIVGGYVSLYAAKAVAILRGWHSRGMILGCPCMNWVI